MTDADPSLDNPLCRAAKGKPRRLAFLRFLAFILLSIGLVIGFTLLTRELDENTPLSISTIAIVQAATAAIIAIATGILIRANREPATYFGWGRTKRLHQFGVGVLSGLGLMTLMLGAMMALGGVSFELLAPGLGGSAANAAIFAVIFVLTAISEEGLLRGYGFVQLARAISFWPASIASSVIFAALHLGNPSETPMGVGAVALVGLVLAYSFRRSGALWFAWGYHAAWDFAESFIYGVPDSGVLLPGALLKPSFQGSDWLTGGSAGPEGSLLIVPALALLAVIAHFALRPAAN